MRGVGLLALKLTLTPGVIVGATLAARRFGPSVGGWLIGLPVTAGPVLLLLALAHGARFAEHVAAGLVAGWRLGLVTGTAAFAATGAALVVPHLRLGLVGLFALMAFATTLAVVLTHLPLTDAYLLAIALTLTIQLASLRAIRS